MCARFEINGRAFRPGARVRAASSQGAVSAVWTGFARSEISGWWRKKGAQPVDIPATRFAERADDNRELVWDTVPPDLVIRGFLVGDAAAPEMKVVTRPAGPAEALRFRHDRMPLLEKPLHPPLPAESPAPGAVARPVQKELPLS